MSLSPRSSIAGLLIASAGMSSAVADVHTLYIDADTHVYATTGMPDFDQRRDGLLDDGLCHCGPTSATNLLAFIAMHGNDHVVPFLPEEAWNEPGTYEAITEYLRQFGINAGTESTDDTCSTSHSAVMAEINAAGDHWVSHHFDVSSRAWNKSNPTSDYYVKDLRLLDATYNDRDAATRADGGLREHAAVQLPVLAVAAALQPVVPA